MSRLTTLEARLRKIRRALHHAQAAGNIDQELKLYREIERTWRLINQEQEALRQLFTETTHHMTEQEMRTIERDIGEVDALIQNSRR